MSAVRPKLYTCSKKRKGCPEPIHMGWMCVINKK